ncbi:phosphatidylethanolamine-binding protein [Butyriboletus roseoflavus]|nr:phosphatidylethanolamine-binding protein [Butyriboletus roseoflavus]
MFAMRRLKTQSVRLVSTTTTLQAASSTVSIPEDASLKKRRTRPFKTRRPNISLEQPRDWKRPLAHGVLPAFDEALKFIKADSEALKVEMQNVQVSLRAAEHAPEQDSVAIRQMEAKLSYLEIQSKINFPEVQWKCANGMANMSKAVDRHIIEQRWRKEGALDLLMERVHQMHVVPDAVPDFHPSFDLRVSFPEHQTKVVSTVPKYKFVEPGIYLLPEQTIDPPRLHKDVFHTDERLYTLIMIDPDVPDEANNTYQSFLHWLQPNIPLSATSPSLISNINSHTKYIPPHPQKGTPYHRYTVLLLPQKSQIDVPVVEMDQRLGFPVREFMAKYNLDGSIGGGAHMWRGEWNPAVSRIYQDLLKTGEPVYGKPPKPDRYADVRGKNRYFL